MIISNLRQETVEIAGIQVPRFLYGTAWKEDATQRLTQLALQAGFRGIDTANQRRHYQEIAVGQAISAVTKAGLLNRDDLFLQTKYTFREGQDDRLPYDPEAPISVQVEQSFVSSLEHLGIDTIDSYLLHGPTQRVGLSAADWAAWWAMEAIHDSGRVRMLGVSNVNLEQLQRLVQDSRVPPRVVQNRCYAVHGWDRRIREFCATNGLIYQGFSLLTANRAAMTRPELTEMAQRYGRSVAQIVLRFALDVGMIVLTGTTDINHMQADLDVLGFCLKPQEVACIEKLVSV